jgi:protoheme ferro-lyase
MRHISYYHDQHHVHVSPYAKLLHWKIASTTSIHPQNKNSILFHDHSFPQSYLEKKGYGAMQKEIKDMLKKA